MQLEPDELLRRFFFYHMISYSVAAWLSSLGAAYTFGVSSLLLRCLREVWEREGETLSVKSQLMYCTVQDWSSRERNVTGLVSSSESRGRSVWSRKCSRTVRSGVSPWDGYSYWTSSTTSTNACLCFGHQKYFCVQSETSAHLSHCVRDVLTQRSWPANSPAPPTPVLNCLPY